MPAPVIKAESLNEGVRRKVMIARAFQLRFIALTHDQARSTPDVDSPGVFRFRRLAFPNPLPSLELVFLPRSQRSMREGWHLAA